MKILLATNNIGKIKEINRIFGEMAIEFLMQEALNYSSVEDGSTYRENAYKKAKFLFDETGGDMSVLAEDSGLEVDALDGAPGVYSAMFTGKNATDEENNKELLQLLVEIPDDKRTARFYSTLCLITSPSNKHDADVYYFEGTVEGMIARNSVGTNGFGYDPVFVPDGYNKTFAELDLEVKNKISHRKKSIEKLKEFLSKHQI